MALLFRVSVVKPLLPPFCYRNGGFFIASDFRLAVNQKKDDNRRKY